MTPIKETIVEALIAKLETITVSNGYDFNAGKRVYRESEIPENVPTPAIVLVQGDETVENDAFQAYRSSMIFAVGMSSDTLRGETADTTAYKMICAIQSCLGPQTIVSLPFENGSAQDVPVQHLETGNGWNSDGQTVIVDVEFELQISRSISDPTKAA